MAAVNGDGEVLVEGEYVGRLQGFILFPTREPRASRVAAAAADQALAGEIAARAQRLACAGRRHFLSDHGRIIWTATRRRSESRCRTAEARAELIAGELHGAAREAVQARLDGWHMSQAHSRRWLRCATPPISTGSRAALLSV